MNFKEILNLTLSRLGLAEGDRRIDRALKEAINYAYLNELSPRDKRLTSAYVPVINGAATLPDDILDIEYIVPELLPTERRVGNSILSDRNTTFKVVYSYAREPLVNDIDVPDLLLKYHFLLSTYACYSYLEQAGMPNAQGYYSEYLSAIRSMGSDDNIKYEVQNVYSQALGDEF